VKIVKEGVRKGRKMRNGGRGKGGGGFERVSGRKLRRKHRDGEI